MENAFAQTIDSRIAQLEKLKGNREIFKAVQLIAASLKKGKKVLVFGNGGSAAQASHFAAELVNRYYFERAGIPAISLVTDAANLTSIANDTDFKYIFSRQIEAIGARLDVALGISTSGTSANVLAALQKAGLMGLKTVALCGRRVESLQKLPVDIVIAVESDDTPTIQEMHLFILHTIAEVLEKIISGK